MEPCIQQEGDIKNNAGMYNPWQARRFVLVEGGDGVADRCVIQPFPAGGLGGAVSPQRGPGQSPGGKHILATIYRKLAKNQVSGSPSTPQLLKFP